MRRLLLALSTVMLLVGIYQLPLRATVSCSVPFVFQNNTVADATQVNANFNSLITCMTTAASAGANSDITSLSGLTTPLSQAQGGTTVYRGGTSTGAANAQVVSTTVPNSFALTAGNTVTFISGFTNTSNMTLNVNGTGAINVFRRWQNGISATVGGEFISGYIMTVVYDGAQYQVISSPPVRVGEILDFAGLTAPPGYLMLGGFCQTRSAPFNDLFTIIGTTYDPTGANCDGAHFAIPDGRGRALFGVDNMGVTDDTGSTAGRLTAAGSACVGTSPGGAGCGQQNRTIAQANLPNVNFSVTGGTSAVGTGVTVNNNFTGITVNAITGLLGGGGLGFAAGGNAAQGIGFSDPQHGHSINDPTHSHTISGNAASGGSGTALATIPPLLVVNKIIKY